MIIPVRCFTCGKPLGHLYNQFKERVEKGESKEKVLNEFGLERYCCRGVFLSHVDLLETVSRYKKA